MAVKFEFHERLYLGESIEAKKVDKIKRRLRSKPFLAKVYLIMPAMNPNDQLDILEAGQLAQPYYAKKSFLVVGMASGYQEALQLIEHMVQDCLREREDCNLREYLGC